LYEFWGKVDEFLNDVRAHSFFLLKFSSIYKKGIRAIVVINMHYMGSPFTTRINLFYEVLGTII
jgi:hypothetical protein